MIEAPQWIAARLVATDESHLAQIATTMNTGQLSALKPSITATSVPVLTSPNSQPRAARKKTRKAARPRHR